MTPSAARTGAYALALAVLTGAAVGIPIITRAFRITVVKHAIYPEDGRLLGSLPTETDSWMRYPGTTDRREEKDVEAVLGTKNYVSRNYVLKRSYQTPREVVLSLHAAYYTESIDTVPHVPDRCFVGGGMMIGEVLGNLPLNFQKDRWHPVEDVPEPLKGHIFEVRAASGPFVKLPRDPGDIRLRTMKFLDRDREVYAGYFFIANGGTVCRAEEVRLLAFDLYTKYAYYMKVQVTSVNGITSGEELADYGGQLIGELLGDLMLCTPDWIKVMRGEYPPPAPGEATPGAAPKAAG